MGTTFCLPPLEDTFGSCANNEANCHAVIAGTFDHPEGSDPFVVSLPVSTQSNSSPTIKQLSIKLGEYSGQYLNAAEALSKLKCAWNEYRAAKKIAHALRLTCQEEIISRKAIDRKVTTE